MSKKYIELKVKFSPLSTGQYHVVVRSSAALEYENSFDWPVRESQNSTSSPDNASANTQVPSHQISSKQTSDSTRHIGEKDSDGVSASRQANQTQAGILKLGSALFQSVFESGERFGNFLRDVQELLPTRDDFRLRFNLEQTPELAIIPWEYIRNPFTSSFLVQEMSLVRDLSPIRTIQGTVQKPLEMLLTKKPLQVLVMTSQADDLETGEEWTELKMACQGHDVNLTHIPPNLNALRTALSEREYHIFHYIGHGKVGEIVLQGNNAQLGTAIGQHELTGERLGVELRGLKGTPDLVVLNTCEGAALEHGDLYSSVAAELIQQGVPAVIAMQFKIKDRSAIDFAAGLYRAIAEGVAIDEALIQARKELYPTDESDPNQTQDWGIPVMYARGKTDSGPGKVLQHFTGLFVGRDQQLRQMQAVLQAVGTSRAAVIRGASGAGKTRMSIELARALHPNDSGQTVYGEADNGDPRPLAWLENMVRGLLKREPDLYNRLAAAEHAVIKRLLSDRALVEGPMPELVSENRLRRNAIRTLLGRFEQTSLLIVDGLYWLDPESLDDLCELWRDPPKHGLCLIATLEAIKTWNCNAFVNPEIN